MIIDKDKIDLPLKIWLPYNAIQKFYWTLFTYEYFCICALGNVAISSDSMITGFILQGCAQLDILNCRLNLLPEIIEKAKLQNKPEEEIVNMEKNILRECVKHHADILE